MRRQGGTFAPVAKVREDFQVRSASAFTLMELVATIVVLATLSSVAMPRFYDLDAEAKKAARRSQYWRPQGSNGWHIFSIVCSMPTVVSGSIMSTILVL